MGVTTSKEGDTVIAKLSGRVKGGTSATTFQEDLQNAISAGSQGMVLDLRN